MSLDRRLWSAQEDQQIIRLVSKYGTKKWPLISQKLCAETEYERTGKQCRQRWYNHLNPEINNSFWSQLDQRRLFEAHKIHGNKWKCISKEFVGRTDNSIKNHFYSTIRRCLRRINKFQGEKNSTLKMRNIKPYVLSKILADRNLTQTILEMGKIKPNKNRKDYNSEYFKEFNQMIEKLYEINKEYQVLKAKKRSSSSHGQDSLKSIQEEEERREEEIDSEEKGESIALKIPEKVDSQDNVKIEESERQDSSPRLSRKGRKPKKRVTINAPSLPQQVLFKQSPLMRIFDSSSSKRYRRPINYMKLNEGILCQTQRQQVDQTNYQSQLTKKKPENFNYDPFNLQNQRENLEEIIQEEQKSNEKDNLNYIFSPDFIELKPLGSFNISNPSPSFRNSNNFNHFDQLVVIGTHLRLTPNQTREVCQTQRKKSEQEFIEQILEINFDPSVAFADCEQQDEQS